MSIGEIRQEFAEVAGLDEKKYATEVAPLTQRV